MALGIPCVLRAADKPQESLKQVEDGSLKLDAAAAKISGPNARLEGGQVKDIIWWTSMDTSLRWKAGIQKPGRYRVEVTYAIIGNNNGSPLAIMIGDQVVKATPKAGSGFNDYKTGRAGEITISKPGDFPVVVKPLERAHEYVIKVRSVNLLPAETLTEAIDIGGGAIKQSTDGSFNLNAGDADINGMNAQLESGDEKNIGFWNDVGTSVIWAINVEKPGNYRVELNYSLMGSYEGSKVAISVGDQTIKARPKPTGEWKNYKAGNAGQVIISKAGDLPVVVKPVSMPGGYVMNLRSVALVPAGTPTEAIDISDKPIAQAPDGSLKLTATNAEIDGQACRMEGGEQKYLVWRNSPDRFITWPIRVVKPGIFAIQLTYSLAKSSYSRQVEVTAGREKFTTGTEAVITDSSDIEVHVNRQNIAATLKAGRDLDDFKTEKLGEVTLDAGEVLNLTLTSTKEPGGLVMHLRSVSLVPLDKK